LLHQGFVWEVRSEECGVATRKGRGGVKIELAVIISH
jgi:hypothetical protein